MSSIRILTNNPKKIHGLQGYGLSVTEQVPIEHTPNPHNEGYLRAKAERMGHHLPSVDLPPVATARFDQAVGEEQEAVAGFGDPVVIFIATLFVVSEAIDSTGVTTWAGRVLLAEVRRLEQSYNEGQPFPPVDSVPPGRTAAAWRWLTASIVFLTAIFRGAAATPSTPHRTPARARSSADRAACRCGHAREDRG